MVHGSMTPQIFMIPECKCTPGGHEGIPKFLSVTLWLHRADKSNNQINSCRLLQPDRQGSPPSVCVRPSCQTYYEAGFSRILGSC